MTCGELGSGIELHFLESGVRVQPVEGRISEERRGFQEAEFEISEEAGLVVQENHLEAEPVHIKIGGHTGYRMFIPEDAISFRHSLDRDTIAHLQLRDAIEVLDRGIISRNFTAAPIPVIVDYILERRDDPNDVITGVRLADEDMKSFMEGQLLGSVSSGIGVQEKIDIVYDNFAIGPSEPVAGYDFQDASPLKALLRILRQFETNAWVTREGVLIVGPDESWGEVMTVLKTDDLEKLANYTITQMSSNTKSVKARGQWRRRIRAGNEIDLNAQAIAERIDVDDGASRAAGEVQVDSLSALEDAVVLGLVTSAMEETAGTIEFDGFVLSEDEKDKVVNMRTGDHIIVDDRVPNACKNRERTFRGGHMNINSIQHRWNSREGWRIILDVAEIPGEDEIDVRSFYYNPRTGERYEDDEVYTGTNETNEEISRFFDDAIEDALGVLVGS